MLLINDQLGSHFVGLLEQKLEKSRFVRVDSDIIDNLIVKADRKSAQLSDTERTVMTELFKSQIPEVEKSEFLISFDATGENSQPVQITQNEYMRRMKEMAAMQRQMSFYGELPDSYNLILNIDHPVVKKVMDDAKSALDTEISPLEKSISALNKRVSELRDKKDASDDEKKELETKEKEAENLRNEENKAIDAYAVTNPLVRQLIDIALLGNNLLKGKALDEFLRRSVELLK